MIKQVVTNFLLQPKVVAAVDVFSAIQKAGQALDKNLYIIAPVIFLISIAIGGLMFAFGRRGAENGKGHLFNVIQGISLFLAAASFVTSIFTLFGSSPQGI